MVEISPRQLTYKIQDKANQIPIKLSAANLATASVTAHKKADEGILLCNQLEKLAQDMKQQFIKIKTNRPLKG